MRHICITTVYRQQQSGLLSTHHTDNIHHASEDLCLEMLDVQDQDRSRVRVRVLPCCAARCGVRARKIHLVEFLPSVAAPPARRAQQRHGVTRGDILSCDTGQHLVL